MRQPAPVLHHLGDDVDQVIDLLGRYPQGLPGGRDWYQHMIYAPGAHTGYGVKTLPGIREAIEDRRWDEANQYIGVVARALNAYSTRLDRAIAAP